jgi:cation diffusion facilitator CzcD-associated flavoprotein CzcO
MKTTCIIGGGIAGMITLLLLQESGADLSKITMVDPFYDGGDLARKWTNVLSNTPWSKTIDSLQRDCPSVLITSPNDPNSCTPLIEIAHLIRKMVGPLLKKIRLIQGTVSSANYGTEKKEWNITVTGFNKQETIFAKQMILSPGGEPKIMNLAIPSIPLEIALDPLRLKSYIGPEEKVVVFGTMHSGTLVIRNLVSNGASVSAYYSSEEPFYWDRNGSYDGIKGEAATIADSIVDGTLPVTLISIKDIEKVIRTSREASWVVYAMGFSRRTIKMSVDNVDTAATEYDSSTGKLQGVPAWGFGTAYPNRAPDGVHWDVGVSPFLEHIKKQIPDIISDNN